MSKNPKNRGCILKQTGKVLAAAVPALLMMILAQTAQALPNNYWFWDPTGNAVNRPTDGNGNWDDTTVSNWWNPATQTFAVYTNWPVYTAGSGGSNNVIIGAGVPGTYNITNIGTVYANTLTFSNANNYTISGGQLTVYANLGSYGAAGLISLPNTTNTIAAPISLPNGPVISNAANSEIIFTGGGAWGSSPGFNAANPANNSAIVFTGGQTYNLGSGTVDISATADITNATVITQSRNDIGRSVGGTAGGTYNVFNGGNLYVNDGGGSATDNGRNLQISRGTPSVVNVYPGGTVMTAIYINTAFLNNVGNADPEGNIRLAPDDGSENGTLNILGGTVLVGGGPSGNTTSPNASPGVYSGYLTAVTFFDGGASVNATAGRAVLNMTSGSLTAFGLQFTTPSGVATSNPTNGINITGGTLYLGAENIGAINDTAYPGTGTNFFCNLSGGTVAAIQNWSPACAAPVNLATVNGNITFQTADINNSPFNMAFSGPLTGVGGFNLVGGGTLTLSGANNYSGATVVSNGTLAVHTQNAPVSGSVTLEGATLATGLPVNSIQPQGGGKSWVVNGNLTYDTGVPTADFNFGSFAPSTTVPAIQVNGNLNFNVTPQVTVEGTAVPKGSYPLIQYTGTLSGTPPSTVVLTGSATSGSIVNNTATKTIELVITGSTVTSPIAWGVGSGIWNTTALNWEANGASVAYSDPDPVAFNDSATGPFPIVVSVASGLVVNPGNIMVSAANGYAITGPGSIGGSTGLTKSGSGALTLSGTNTYSGGTTVDGGTVNINYGGNGANNSAIGIGALTLNSGAQIGNTSGTNITLLTPIAENWNNSWSYVGTNNLSLGTATITLGSTLTLTVITNTVEIDGQITDNGLGYGLQVEGNGELTLSNLNTFTGGLGIDGGTVNIDADGALGTGPLTLENSAIFDNTSGSALTLVNLPSSITLRSATFLGTTNLDMGAVPIGVPSTAVLNISNNTLSVEGSIGGANTSVTKNGAGAWTIGGSGVTTATGITINGGTIYANRSAGDNCFSSAGLTINSTAAVIVISPTGSQFNNLTPITLSGGLLDLNGDNGETIASLTLNSGILRNSGSAVVLNENTNANVTDVWTLAGTNDFDVTNGSSLTLNGTLTGTVTNAVLLKTGAGELIMPMNAYAGNTTVSNGVLSIDYPNLSTNSTVTVAPGAVLDLNFTNTVITTNIVAAFVLNGVSEPAGLYNSNNVSQITSGGSLLVVPLVTVNPNPGRIQFSLVGNNTWNLAWPTNAGWYLQVQTNSLQTGLSTNWVTVPGSESITSTNITINPKGATFYRLMNP